MHICVSCSLVTASAHAADCSCLTMVLVGASCCVGFPAAWCRDRGGGGDRAHPAAAAALPRPSQVPLSCWLAHHGCSGTQVSRPLNITLDGKCVICCLRLALAPLQVEKAVYSFCRLTRIRFCEAASQGLLSGVFPRGFS